MDDLRKIADGLKKRYLDIPSSQRPTMIFIGGIPGAGKSLLVEKSKIFFPNDVFSVIDVDLFRPYFKNFTTVEETVKFSNMLEMELFNSLIDARKNIILVGTMRAYDYINGIIQKKLIPSDYAIFFHLMITNQLESTISAYERYISDKLSNNPFPRLVRCDYLNKAYNGFHSAIRKYNEKDYFGNNRLFVRGKKMMLPNEITYTGDISDAIIKVELGQLASLDYSRISRRVEKVINDLETEEELQEFYTTCEKVLKIDYKRK